MSLARQQNIHNLIGDLYEAKQPNHSSQILWSGWLNSILNDPSRIQTQLLVVSKSFCCCPPPPSDWLTMPIVVVVFASATASDIERHVLIIMRPSQVTQVSSVSYCGSCAGQCRSFPSIGKTRPGMERMSWVCLGRCLAMAATVVDPRHTLSPVIHLQRRRESPFISLPNDELPIEHFRRPRSETTIKY